MNLRIFGTVFVATFLLLPFPPSSFAWRQFEQPLELAKPNSDGIYEFDLLVEHKMSMSTQRNGQQTLMVDFSPNEGQWSLRGENGSRNAMAEQEWPDLVQLDGKHGRVVTINGQSPGQVLVVPFGAKVAMRVRNRLPSQALTIHLHGMDKMRAWWTDGVAFVQQCPIQPGQDFVYRFIADTVGTHWYHGHLMNDRADGILGGFVVKKSEENGTPELKGQKVDIGRQYYSILQDWSSVPSQEQWLCQLQSTMKWLYGFDEPLGNGPRKKCWAPKRTYDASNVGGSVPLSAILIGEKGWHRQGDILRTPSKLPLTTFPIKQGENVLLRLVNGGVSQGFMVWAEGHEMWVLAADGADVKPKQIDALIIFPGERYDILIKGRSKVAKQRFWLQFETMEYINWDWTIGKPQLGLAQLHYEDIAEEGGDEKREEEEEAVDWAHSQCTPDRKCVVLNCPFAQFPPAFNLSCFSAHLLESATPVGDRELVEQKKFAEDKFHEVFANMHADNHFDGWMFSLPNGIPYYYEGRMERVARQCDPRKCDHENSAHWEKGCQCFVHFNFTLGNIVQITVYNMGDMANPHGLGYSHPLHIHGTHFLLLKVGYGGYHAENGSIATMNPDIPCTDPNSRCVGLSWTDPNWLLGNLPGMQQNPSWRDTVNIPVGGYVTIRFRAQNPGWWFAHCHLMLHNMGGTAFAFRIGRHEEVPMPPESYPNSCGIYEEP